MRYAIREAGKQNGGRYSQWGPIWGHNHQFVLSDLEADDMAVFPLRDPVTRFVSGFYSRLREAHRGTTSGTRGRAAGIRVVPHSAGARRRIAERRRPKRWRAKFAMQSTVIADDMTFWTEAVVPAEEPGQGPLHRAAGDPLGRLGEDQGAARPAARSGPLAGRRDCAPSTPATGRSARRGRKPEDVVRRRLQAARDRRRGRAGTAQPTRDRCSTTATPSLRGSSGKRSAAAG